jgi:uncharacterized membrane protein
MADYDPSGALIPHDAELDGQRAWGHVMYALHALAAISGVLTSATIVGSFISGGPSIIAVIINYLTRSRVRGTWLDSHWRWQLRTFWYTVLWVLVAGALTLTVVGVVIAIPMVIIAGCWVLYRVWRGWSALFKGRGLPLPD